MNLTFPVDAKLKDGSPVQLVLADNQDIEPLQRLYRVNVEEGTSYPHNRFPDEDACLKPSSRLRDREKVSESFSPSPWEQPSRGFMKERG